MMMMKKLKTLSALIYFVIAILASPDAEAQEHKYKAKFIVNLISYINWSSDEVTIGVMGNSPILIDLESLVQGSKRLKLVKISSNESIADCDLIFLPTPQTRNFTLVDGIIESKPIIIIAENESLIEKGAEMAFVMEDNRLRFAINQKEMEAKGVTVSSKLIAQSKLY